MTATANMFLAGLGTLGHRGRSGNRGEQLGEHAGALGRGSNLQAEDGSVEVETEVEEGAALLLGRGQGDV